MNTKDIIKDLKNLKVLFDFSNLVKKHELFSNKNKKREGFLKMETLKKIWIHEFVCLRGKMYSFKCVADSKNKVKEISKSQSKHVKFEEYKKCLDGEEYQKVGKNYILRSINHEWHLQKVKKNQHYLYSMIDDVI